MPFSWSDLQRLATADSLKSWPRWWRAVEAGAAGADPGSALGDGLYEVWANAVTGGEAGAYRRLGAVVGALRARIDGFAEERPLPGTLAALPEALAVREAELVQAVVATHFLPPPEDAEAMARRVETFYRDFEGQGWRPWDRPLPNLAPPPFLPADPDTLAQLRAALEALPSDRADLRTAIACLRGYLQAQEGIVVALPLPIVHQRQGTLARLFVRFLPGSRPAPYRLTGGLSERQREWLEWERLWCRFPLPWNNDPDEAIRLLWSLKGASLAAQGLLDQAGLEYQVQDECLDLHVTGFTAPLGGDSLGLAVALAILARAYGSPLGLAVDGDIAPSGSFAPLEAVKWLAENPPGAWEANRKARETWAERVYLQREIGPVGHLEAKVAAGQSAGRPGVLPAALPPEGKPVPEGPGVLKVATLDQASERLLLDPWQNYLNRFPPAPLPDWSAETPLARFLVPVAQAHGGGRWLHFAANPAQTATEAGAMLAALYRTVCSQPRSEAKWRSDGTPLRSVPDYKPRVPLALSAAEVAPTDTLESLVCKSLIRAGIAVEPLAPFIPRAVREGRFLFCLHLSGGEWPGVRSLQPPPGGDPPALFADGGLLARLREPAYRDNGVLLVADGPESVSDLAERLADFTLLEPPPDPAPTAWRGHHRDSRLCRYVPLHLAVPGAGPLTLESVGEPVPARLAVVGRVREEAGNQVVAVCDDGRMIVYDAELRPLAQWSVGTPPFTPSPPGLIDTTGNGLRDLCVGISDPPEVRLYDGHGHLLRTLPAPPHRHPWTQVSVMGVDDGHGGGTPRIFVHWGDPGLAGEPYRLLAAYEARQPERFWTRPWGALSQQGIAVGDLTGNGRRTELVVSNWSPSNGCAPEVDGVIQGPDWHTFLLSLNDQGEFLFPPRSLSGSFANTEAGVVDLDGDGCDEVVLLTSAGCDVASGTVQTREIPDYIGLNLTWLCEPIADFEFRTSEEVPDSAIHNPQSEIGIVVQLGRWGRDERGREVVESAGLWRWTLATDEWEPLTVPGLSESASFLADGLEDGSLAFFDPVTTALLQGTLPADSPTPVQSPEHLPPAVCHSSPVIRHSSPVPLFDPSQMAALLTSPDALLNPPHDRQEWLINGDRLQFAVRPDHQARRIAGAAAPDGRRLAVPMGMSLQSGIDRRRYFILRDLWLFEAGTLPRQLTYRDDLNLCRPVWDPTGRLIAVESRRLDRFEPITEVWVVRVADRRLFYVGPGEQPQWDPRQSGHLLAFLRDGAICYVAAPAEWLAG